MKMASVEPTEKSENSAEKQLLESVGPALKIVKESLCL